MVLLEFCVSFLFLDFSNNIKLIRMATILLEGVLDVSLACVAHVVTSISDLRRSVTAVVLFGK